MLLSIQSVQDDYEPWSMYGWFCILADFVYVNAARLLFPEMIKRNGGALSLLIQISIQSNQGDLHVLCTRLDFNKGIKK